MKGIDTLGVGQGMMQGLELYRQHEREDDTAERTRQQHDMNMKQGAMNLEQAGLQLEHYKEDRPLVRRQLERGDKSGEMEMRAKEIAQAAQEAIQRAQAGDINALNEFSFSINPGNPAPPMVMPSDKRGMVKYRNPQGGTEEVPLRDILTRTAELGRPDVVMEKLLAGEGGQYSEIGFVEGVGYGQYGPDGEFKQFTQLDKGKGGAGGFGGYNKDTLGYYRQKSADFWGKMNPDGSFFVPEEAREQRDLAEQRMAEFEQVGISPQAAARYGNLSVLPPLDEQSAREFAMKEGMKMGLTDEWGPKNSLEDYVEAAVPDLIAESQEAHEIYQQLTGGGIDAALGYGSSAGGRGGVDAGGTGGAGGANAPQPGSVMADDEGNQFVYLGGDPAAPDSYLQIGSIHNGYRYKGGDPGIQSNWEPVQ